jgi:Pyridoxamine 5'-phosphate oxidase
MNRDEVLAVLNSSVAQRLMADAIPARIAYTAQDGSPRVVPLAFQWTGESFVFGTLPYASKISALEADPRVALTIDTESFPPDVLLVRGRASVEVVDGVFDEYVEGSRRLVGDDGMPEWEAGVRHLYDQMAKVTIEPQWAKVLDFETTLPSAVEEAIRRKTPQA